MCKFCENTEEFTPFIEKRVEFLPCESLFVSGGINEDMKLEICGLIGSGTLFTAQTKINFCPECGKKLVLEN